MKSVIAKLRAKRIEKGLTVSAVAELLGVSQQAVSHWENGYREPTWEILDRWSSVLGLAFVADVVDPAQESRAALLDRLLDQMGSGAAEVLIIQAKALAASKA